MKVEDQIEAQYSAIQSRINELEPGKLRAYNELLSKYVQIAILTLRCAVLYFSLYLRMSYFTEMGCIALSKLRVKLFDRKSYGHDLIEIRVLFKLYFLYSIFVLCFSSFSIMYVLKYACAHRQREFQDRTMHCEGKLNEVNHTLLSFSSSVFTSRPSFNLTPLII